MLYEKLTGDWAVFARIAGPFTSKLPVKDREDWLHSSMLEMAKVRAKYEAMGKRLTEAGLMKVASYEFKGYWDRRRYELYGVNCTHCSSEQRGKCRTIEKSQCPKGKARIILRLNKILMDGDGGRGELGSFVPDNNSIDLDAWVDARRELRCLPKRLIRVGYKYYSGYRLTASEQNCLSHRRSTYIRRKDKPRVFVYDGREFPDPDPNPALTPDEARRLMADFFPELADAEVRGYKRDNETVFELMKRVGIKGGQMRGIR